jgi:hypothetical protein
MSLKKALLKILNVKHMGKPSQILFLDALPSNVESWSKLLVKVYHFFTHTPPVLPLIILYSLAVFFHCHLLGFYSSLVITLQLVANYTLAQLDLKHSLYHSPFPIVSIKPT